MKSFKKYDKKDILGLILALINTVMIMFLI